MTPLRCLFTIMLVLMHNSHVESYDYYVSSKNGNDKTGNGSISNPWKSIQTAQNNVGQLIKTLNKQTLNQNITINIDNSGYYDGINDIKIEDSLTDFSNKHLFVIYQSTNSLLLDPSPSIHGDCIYIPNDWTKVSSIGNDMTLFKTNLKAFANDLPKPNGLIFEIFMNGIRMNISKSPLYQYNYLNSTTGIIETDNKMIKNIEQILSTDYANDNLMALVYEDWTSSYHYVKHISFNDSFNGQINISLKTSPNTWVNDPGSGNRFYLLNNMQLLLSNSNNSFYFNKTSYDLYVLLYNKSNITDTDEFIIPKSIEILSINGSNNNKVERILFRNIDFMYTAPDFSTCLNTSCMGPGQSAWELLTATVHIMNADQIIFDNVNISHTGGFALWFDAKSTNCIIQNSYINDLGAGGIRLGSDDVPCIKNGNYSNETLYNAINISIHNNYIMNGGQIFEAGPGILAGAYSQSNITNNAISKFKNSGISSGYCGHYGKTSVRNNNVNLNMIFDLGQFVLSDMGCVYTSGEQYNTLYSNNICHDVYSFNYGGWGLYSDQATRGATFTKNIVYNTKCAGNHQHFGLDNIFVNNIYAFGETIFETADGAVRSSQHAGECNYTSNPGACSSFTFITNIVYVNNTWKYDILWDEFHSYWKNITVDGNTYWSIQQKTQITFPDNYTIKEWVNEGKDVQHAIADPMFVDADNYNFDLKPGSPAIALGFHPIDTTNVGPNW